MNGGDELNLRRGVAVEAVRAAGTVHLQNRGRRFERTIHHGERTDFATRVDFEAQEAVKSVVQRHFASERVVGEEDEDWNGLVSLLDAGCWLTDPLDGTLDYVHGGPGFSCIVSYVRRGEPLVCAMYFPAWSELYTAATGMGASLNGKPVHVSGVTRLDGAIVSTAYRGSDPQRSQAFAARIARLLPHIESIRLPGAPGVMAAAVASGRYDLFASFGQSLEPSGLRPFTGQPWETAAFVLLVAEAGGAVAAASGGPPDLVGFNTYAATRALLEEYQRLAGQLD